MLRPLRTALLAVSLGAFSFGFPGVATASTAPASAEQIVTASDAVAGPATVEGASASAAAAEAAQPAPSAPVQLPARAEPLARSEPAVEMPAADGDLSMWAPGKNGVSAVSGVKDRDAMHRFAHGIVRRTSAMARSLTRNAMRYIGTPYVFGGTSPSGFDCSGYVQHVFALLGVALPRTADEQYYAGRRPTGGIVTGDLVFFQTYLPGPSHVGIYLGKGKFIHSSGHGVMVSRLRDRYWSVRYLGAKRVVAAR